MKRSVKILVMVILGAYPITKAYAEEVPAVPSQEQPEVLTSGPVHEAFAKPVNLQVQEGVIAPKAPPANIVENAPPERPEGDQFVLVPGYWAWDSDRGDYIWVSACWRAAPPNTYWVPGYWAKVDNGWEWVAGYWAPIGSQEIQYLPPPPAVAEVEPVIPAPSEDFIWVPPCQYWYHGGYVLRAGYWLAPQAGWVWVPSNYIWTPRGYVFSPGHWDYALERRGVLFAPVYFPRAVYIHPGYVYSPSIVISVGALQVNLFTYPRYCHYYFGDYYDDVYISVGIFPWFECERRHGWYDPIFVYDRWHHHRSNPHWLEDRHHDYDVRHHDRDLRPPRTYREMERREAKLPEKERKNFRMARPMSEVVANRATMKFDQVSPRTQRKINSRATEAQKYREERNRWESPTTVKTAEPTRGKETGTGPFRHKEQTVKPTEGKGPEVKPAERKETVVTQPAEQRKEPMVTRPMERKEPVTVQPVERKPTVIQPKVPPTQQLERKAPTVTQTAERKEQVTAPKEKREAVMQPAVKAPEFVKPRDVKKTEPETVKIPKSPIVGKSVEPGKTKGGMPARPAEERRQVENGKDKGGDKGKGKGR